jgi:hypothetical protein
MQALGGLVEAGIGAGMTIGTGGAGGLAGWLIMAHGLDQCISGMRTALSGTHQTTATAQLLQKTGMSAQTAALADNCLSMANCMGGAAAMRASRSVIPKLHNLTISANSLAGDLGNIPKPRQMAFSARQGGLLKEHLRQFETYGPDGFKKLNDGRLRYYGQLSPANKPGEMMGRRMVREWNPEKGLYRTWHETLDVNANIRIVRPQSINNAKTHYNFDKNGLFSGEW